MKTTTTLIILLMIAFALIFMACGPQEKKAAPTTQEVTAKVEYTCPMHPEIIKVEPGKCSICGMDLVKKEVNPKADSASMEKK